MQKKIIFYERKKTLKNPTLTKNITKKTVAILEK